MSTVIYNRTTNRWVGVVMTLTEADFVIYCGPLALAKKGREEQKQLTDLDIQRMQQQMAQQKVEQGAADKTIGGWETQGKPGQLSPAAAAQLASDNDNIARTYNGMRQQAFASMGARGFGAAPSGFGLAAQNAVNQGEAQAGTGAFRNAQKNTQALQEAAVNARMGLSGQNQTGTSAASQEGSDAAYKQSQMGSTLGDIGQGIATAGQIAGSILAPGSGILSSFKKLGSYGGGGSGGPSSGNASGSWFS